MIVIVYFFWGGVSQVAPVVKNSPASAGDVRKEFHPWVEKILWRWTWQAIVHRVTESGTQLKRQPSTAQTYMWSSSSFACWGFLALTQQDPWHLTRVWHLTHLCKFVTVTVSPDQHTCQQLFNKVSKPNSSLPWPLFIFLKEQTFRVTSFLILHRYASCGQTILTALFTALSPALRLTSGSLWALHVE